MLGIRVGDDQNRQPAPLPRRPQPPESWNPQPTKQVLQAGAVAYWASGLPRVRVGVQVGVGVMLPARVTHYRHQAWTAARNSPPPGDLAPATDRSVLGRRIVHPRPVGGAQRSTTTRTTPGPGWQAILGRSRGAQGRCRTGSRDRIGGCSSSAGNPPTRGTPSGRSSLPGIERRGGAQTHQTIKPTMRT